MAGELCAATPPGDPRAPSFEHPWGPCLVKFTATPAPPKVSVCVYVYLCIYIQMSSQSEKSLCKFLAGGEVNGKNERGRVEGGIEKRGGREMITEGVGTSLAPTQLFTQN